MRPALAAEVVAPRRMVFICTTLGLHPGSFWPKTPGSKYESTEYLKILEDHRDQMTLFSGLEHEGQAGRQPHDSQLTWLTAARSPGMDGFRNSVSVDQYAASKLGFVTRFPSVVLGSNTVMSQSFTQAGVMVPSETSPAKLFEKLFLQGKPDQVRQQKQQLDDGKSILDQLGSQMNQLDKKASRSDHNQLEQYFNSIREAEKEISEARGWIDKPKPKTEAEPPKDINDRADLIGRTRLLMKLIPLVLESDSSRVVSLMIQDHFTVPKVEGVTAEHHNLSHHGRDPKKIEQLNKIEGQILECFGELLGDMKSRSEGSGNLLQNTSVLFGSNLGNANAHDPTNLPTLLAGGRFRHGSYIKQNKPKPLCDLFLTMLNGMGIETESFAQSRGTLTW
jgi:hypothetical protein